MGTNIALKSYGVYFNPLNMGVQSDGSLKTLKYVDKRPGTKVLDDGKVEFSFFAPNAERVEVCGISGTFPSERVPLEKQEDGWFVKCVEEMPSGFHYFHWFVDDVQAGNPEGMLCYGCMENTDFVDVPEREDDFYLRKSVPHGTINYEMYQSGENSRTKYALIYTPPGYEENPQKTYPVLYLQHGVGECETSWVWNGKASYIIDNLLAEGKCEEMIVVMNAGYAFRPGENPVFFPGDFDAEMVYDCMPFIEEKYRIKKGRINTAIAGLSLGSAQAAYIAVKHPDLFGYVGVFSGVISDAFAEAKEKDITFGAIFLGSGISEGLANANREIAQALRKPGVNVIVKEYSGYHEWSPWRHCLFDYVQNIFKEEYIPEYPSTLTNSRREASPIAAKGKDYLFTGRNQALESNALFNDPINFTIIHPVDENGRPTGQYVNVPKGVEVLGEGVVRFYYHTDAKAKLEVAFNGNTYLMHSDEAGYYTCVVDKVAPGFYYVDFLVNGTRVVNPIANVGYGSFRNQNYFEMEDPDFNDYYLRHVKHGSVHLRTYRSGICGSEKPLYIYTPYGYETSSKAYPVIYLQHGGGENETGWI